MRFVSIDWSEGKGRGLHEKAGLRRVLDGSKVIWDAGKGRGLALRSLARGAGRGRKD